jgi:hypothetical protein
MSTKTPAELAEAVLKELVVIDITETPDDEDADPVIEAYQLKYAEKARPGFGMETVWHKRDEIPEEIFLIWRDLIINEVKGSFGEPMSPQEKDANEIFIMKRLLKMIGKPGKGTRTFAPEAYF